MAEKDFLAEFKDQQTKSLKGREKTFRGQIKKLGKSALDRDGITAENKETINDVISQITTAMSVGSKPKREDFIDAAKELTDIQNALSEVGASDEVTFNSDALGDLQAGVQKGLDFIAEQKPSLKGTVAKGIKNKMTATSTGFIKSLAMETVSGIPFGANVVDWMGEKMSSFGESMTQGKKLTETELGIGRAFTGGADVSEDTEDIVEDATEKTAKTNGGVSTGPTTKVKGIKEGVLRSAEDFVDARAERLGGLSELPTAEGTGGGLAETNEILRDILEAVKPDAETDREAERERELERLEDQKKGGRQTGKPEDGKGLFGKFNFMNLFKKGGIGKLLATLGTTLFGGLTSAFGATGVVGKGFLAKMGPTLMKFIGPAALLAGLAMAIKDGVDGWFKSDEWGVSKLSGALGGLFGGTGKAGSFGNVAGNALKWGLIGAGLGSFVPIIGTGIGFALGALLGAILGYFGGEKIAKAIDAMGKWFDEKWNGFLNIFGLGDDKVTAEAEKKASKGKQDIDKKRLEFTEKEIKRLESKDEPLSEEQQTRLEGLKVKAKKLGGTIKEREISSGKGGSGLTIKQREKELKELTASKEDTTGFWKGDVKGIEESASDLEESKVEYEEKKIRLAKGLEDAYEGIDPYGNMGKIRESHPQFEEFVTEYVSKAKGLIERNEAAWKEKQDAHQWMIDRKELLLKEDQAAKDAGLKVKLQEGGIVPGKEGEPVPVLAHGKEIFFDNESSERMHKVASLLEGTDFKSMEELFYNAKESAGYNILMDKFLTSGMLESKHGGMLKNVAMLFGLAGHGQLGQTKKHGTMVDKFSMGPETIEKLFEKLNYFKERVPTQKKRSSETGSRWTKGREKNLNELNAVRAIQEISRSMALLGDSPEEKEALEKYDKMTMEEKILSEMSREEAEERGQALKIDLKQRWGNFAKSDLVIGKNFTNFAQSDLVKGKNFTNFAKGVGDKDKIMYESLQPQTGTQLNAAAMDRVGYEGEKSSRPPTIVDASTVQNIVNNTQIRPPNPTGQYLPDEKKDFGK